MNNSIERAADYGGSTLDEAVAIVGLGAVFPGGATLEDFWGLVERGVDTSRPVPSGRWTLDSLEILRGPGPLPDGVYTDRGCFIENFRLDPAGINLPPDLLETVDPSVHILLQAGRNALGTVNPSFLDRARTGAILGNIALPSTASSLLSEEILDSLLQQTPARPLGKRAFNGHVMGLPGGLLARAFGLGGGTCTLDAACASSLYAVKLACDQLLAGRANAMLAGGLSRPDSLYTQMGFCQLRALSLSGRCSPFDLASDGLLVGEGAGIVVLKRLSDALRDGDHIRAVIRGIGLSNDLDGNLLSPSSEGQLRALKQAYAQAGWTPNDVDFIECHATGTPVGDAVEFESLQKLWLDCKWRPGQCVLGAVKANIGHLLTAAGSASLIKCLLAFEKNIFPPMANFRQPAGKISLAESPFRILQSSQPWHRRAPGVPRRAAINGFGFGGINAHLLIEEWLEEEPRPRKIVARPVKSSPIAIVGMAVTAGPWPNLQAFRERVLGGRKDQVPSERATFQALGLSQNFPGYYLEDFEIPVNRYRIPPRELAELLPQQALMLEVAGAALADAGSTSPDSSRVGVFIGLGLDVRTADFHYRWSKLSESRPEIVPDESAPPLTADRTLGALAGITASRIAKEFRFGGPSHTVCSEDCSGTRALEIAVLALRQNEIDQALAGAVDVTGDLRTLLAKNSLFPYSRTGVHPPFDLKADGIVPGEGAVAFILKRLDDAVRDGDRVYALVRGIGNASGDYVQALRNAYGDASLEPGSVGYIEASGAARPSEDADEVVILDSFFAPHRKSTAFLSSAKSDAGDCGAASSLIAAAKASLALYHEVIPAMRGLNHPIPGLDQARALKTATENRYWARNRAEGPRRAGICTSSIDGNHTHILLEACEHQSASRASSERAFAHRERPETMFVVRAKDESDLISQLKLLREAAASADGLPLGPLAQEWARPKKPSDGVVISLIAQDTPQLLRLAKAALSIVQRGGTFADSNEDSRDRDRIFYLSTAKKLRGEVAFVFPGAGTYFAGMGRDLAFYWPEILRAQDRENDFLADQMFTDRFWSGDALNNLGDDHRPGICAQVALGAMMSDLARFFGLKPDASIGYSLGESTGLFALRAWTARDEMLRRVTASTLFSQDLTGTPENLRRVWNTAPAEPVEWKAGVVDRSAEQVKIAMTGINRVYILIINTPNECVIGGNSAEIRALVKKLDCHWFPLEGVSTVHCELFHPVREPYRQLHLFETSAPAGVRFFSGGWGRAYTPDKETAAAAIVAQASGCIDFPKVIREAYDSGIRFFIEMGPGNSCSRMISQNLEGKPHFARSLCASAQDPLLNLLRLLAQLIAHDFDLDLNNVQGGQFTNDVAKLDVRTVRIPIVSPVFNLPGQNLFSTPASAPSPRPDPFEMEFIEAMTRSQAATISAHKAYLDFSQNLFQTLSQTITSQFRGDFSPLPALAPPPRLDRNQCLEFARGSVARVLGENFRAVDAFPTRVRLPDEPLMLVDRILQIDGEPCSMSHGRVITEHDIHPNAWYLDCGRIPTCIAVEAGQADLFLSGYLGIDFQTEGLAVYRLLDAKVCFHRGMPGPGEVIHYDIRINQFFRQGGTWLFRFGFEATVSGEKFLTMTDGCAGFFSQEALASGRGIVRTAIDLKPVPGKRSTDWIDFVPMRVESYAEDQLEALRGGNLAACFGHQFADIQLKNPLVLPSGKMKLVHRIPHLDPKGGQFGLGLIRGEADIHPNDWFLACHFVDDRVMPGTLMFECCLHTLRVFLLRMGWVAELDAIVLEPIPGVVGQLKCRGQVLETTRIVTYEVSLKELGYRPEPYVIADALMYADGKPIVEISNMSLRYSGITLEMLREIWSPATPPLPKPAVYDSSRILAYAVGKPSEAFGPPYQIFDEKRRLARLPGPPYLFLDRITEVQGEAFQMVPGGLAEAEYFVPPDAWYFEQNRQDIMPFAVLLEIALQPCGWLAAYAGSALTSKDVDVSFRNLGGTGTQFVAVTPETGLLTTRVKLTRVSSSAGMILQWFDIDVSSARCLIYKGDTYFGFFPKAALAKQEGIQNARLYIPSQPELVTVQSLPFPASPPFPGPQLRMVDQIECFLADGGPRGMGYIRATKRVRPSEWFFKAHFYQDPVMPGSLGLESLLQLGKFLATQRWGHSEGTVLNAVARGQPHEWIYRGQVIPEDHTVSIEAMVVEVNEEDHLIVIDGFLSVDGRVIYEMKHFTVQEQKEKPVQEQAL